MSSLLGTLLQSGMTNDLFSAMSGKTGLDQDNISQAVSMIAPVLMQQANANFKGDQDSGALLDIINQTDLDTLQQNPDQMLDTTRGNALLGQLLGSKEQSRSLAAGVGDKLGIDPSMIKSLLPLIAPVVAGMLNRQVQTSQVSQTDTGSVTSMLSGFLDQDGDGSVADDLLGMAGKFFG